jgi:hypothetical protein
MNTKGMLVFFVVFTIAAIAFMCMWLVFSDALVKAQIYDHFEGQMLDMLNCTIMPRVVCDDFQRPLVMP